MTSTTKGGGGGWPIRHRADVAVERTTATPSVPTYRAWCSCGWTGNDRTIEGDAVTDALLHNNRVNEHRVRL